MSCSAQITETLEAVIRQSGEGSLLDHFVPRDGALNHIRRTLEAVNQRACERLGGDAPDLSESALIEEYRLHPHQVRGFFQALAITQTPDMLLMVWRIIQGMEVKDVQINYRRQADFQVQVILESPFEVEDAPYVSTRIQDFTLFRHVGVIEISGRPVLEGFYALMVRGT